MYGVIVGAFVVWVVVNGRFDTYARLATEPLGRTVTSK